MLQLSIYCTHSVCEKHGQDIRDFIKVKSQVEIECSSISNNRIDKGKLGSGDDCG